MTISNALVETIRLNCDDIKFLRKNFEEEISRQSVSKLMEINTDVSVSFGIANAMRTVLLRSGQILPQDLIDDMNRIVGIAHQDKVYISTRFHEYRAKAHRS